MTWFQRVAWRVYAFYCGTLASAVGVDTVRIWWVQGLMFVAAVVCAIGFSGNVIQLTRAGEWYRNRWFDSFIDDQARRMRESREMWGDF